MTTTDQFLMALRAYQEIQVELQQAEHPLPVFPVSSRLAVPVAAVPHGSLLLGTATNGRPLSLDLHESATGPLLVVGDSGSGKTAFLRSLARASDLRDPGDIQFGVLTPFPDEWTALEMLPNCLGVWPAHHPSAQHFVAQLISWAEALAKTRQVVLLLFEGLDSMTGDDFKFQGDLRWLLTRGPENRIWPVVAVNPGRLIHLRAWLDYFCTYILGQMRCAHNLGLLADDPGVNLADLEPGNQFILSRPDGWTKFWLSPLE